MTNRDLVKSRNSEPEFRPIPPPGRSYTPLPKAHHLRTDPPWQGLALPSDIAAGLTEIGKRTGWNKTAPKEYALPTETWREVVERRKRCDEIRKKLANEDVHEVNGLIILNLEISQFAQDVIQYAEGPELIRAFYKAITEIVVTEFAEHTAEIGEGEFVRFQKSLLRCMQVGTASGRQHDRLDLQHCAFSKLVEDKS